MIATTDDETWMGAALDEARAARAAGEVPVGAVIVRDGAMVARAANRTVRDGDPTAHAELLAIRAAAASVGSWRLDDCVLYVTLEPCAMCVGAIVLARLDRVVFGAWDDKGGMVGSIVDLLRHPRLNHRPQVLAGVRAAECGEVLTRFFRDRRDVGNGQNAATGVAELPASSARGG
jgi:tRNA(adenine34) deaminase